MGKYIQTAFEEKYIQSAPEPEAIIKDELDVNDEPMEMQHEFEDSRNHQYKHMAKNLIVVQEMLCKTCKRICSILCITMPEKSKLF